MSIYWKLMEHSSTPIFRKGIPEDLRPFYGKREIKESLRKLSPEARPVRLLELHRYWEEQFYLVRNGGTQKTFAPVATSIISAKATSTGPLLSAMFDSWSKTKLHATTSTRSEWERAVRYFTELHGDLPVDGITKAQLVEYRDALLKLPRKPSKTWQRMTLPQKLASIQAGAMAEKELISPKSVNKYLTALSALFEKACKEGIITTNLAQGLKFDAKHTRDDRLAFDEADLKAIFAAPLFLEKRHDECYWAMLLGLYTGARLEEIGQLYLKDFRQKDAVWYLDINSDDADKSLKTASSARRIPLHQDLLALGLIEHVQAQQQAGAVRLFPRLQKDKRNKYTTALSKRLNRLIDGVGVQDKRKTFHSLRHTFRDYAAHHDMHEERIETIMGHANGKTSRAYGSGSSLLKLNESLQQIRFPIFNKNIASVTTRKLHALPDKLEEYYTTLPKLQLSEVTEELASALHLPNGVMLAMLQQWNAVYRTGDKGLGHLSSPTALITREELINALHDFGRMH